MQHRHTCIHMHFCKLFSWMHIILISYIIQSNAICINAIVGMMSLGRFSDHCAGRFVCFATFRPHNYIPLQTHTLIQIWHTYICSVRVTLLNSPLSAAYHITQLVSHATLSFILVLSLSRNNNKHKRNTMATSVKITFWNAYVHKSKFWSEHLITLNITILSSGNPH